jgi:hypothetical protein
MKDRHLLRKNSLRLPSPGLQPVIKTLADRLQTVDQLVDFYTTSFKPMVSLRS